MKDPTMYKQLVGKLLYLTFTRLDICYVVQVLSQFIDRPSNDYLFATLWVLRYLTGAPRQGLLMHSQSNLKMQAYFDSDRVSCPNTRKLVTRYALFLGNSMVNWKAKKQLWLPKVQLKLHIFPWQQHLYDIVWIKFLLVDFGICQTDVVKLYCDY